MTSSRNLSYRSISRCPRRGGNRVGLTLIELVTASALAVIMLMAISGTLRSMRAQKKALLDGPLLQSQWQYTLTDQIQWDLANARGMVAHTGELRLLGFCGHDPKTRETTHRLVEVIYSVRDIGERRCLLRQERSLDTRSNHNTSTELVGIGVAGIVLLGQKEGESDHSSEVIESLRNLKTQKQKTKSHSPDQWVPIPKTFRLLLLDEKRQPMTDQMVVL